MIHKSPEKISFPELQNTFRRVLKEIAIHLQKRRS